MKRAHLLFGIAALFAFILSGQYMDKVHGHLRGIADAPRMLFRSRHIYMLLTSLLNLGLGTYLKPQPLGWRAGAQLAGSIMIIGATCLLVVAFLYEPLHGNLNYTPFSHYGLYLVALGTVGHAIAGAEKHL